MNNKLTWLSSSRLKRSAVGAAVVLTSVAALGASAGGAAAAPKPKEGGNLTFLIGTTPAGWVSSASSISSYEGNIWGEITDKLVYLNDAGQVSPWIATSWKQENAARTYILNIKHGVTFSDGEKLNAAAVVDNINIWAKGNPSAGVPQVGLFPSIYFKRALATGPYTVKVEFYKPTLGFIPTLGYHGCILLSPKTLALPVSQQANLLDDIGSGPYTVKSYTQGVTYTLVKRKNYNWGPPALGHTGPAYIDTLTYNVVADADTREQAVESGQADVDFNPNVADINSLRKSGFHVYDPRYLGFVDGFYVNASEAPTNNLYVRLGLEHAINRAQIISTVYPKGWLPAESIVQSNVPGVADESALFKYDPSLAAADFAKAGYTKNSSGVLEKDGQPLTLQLVPNPYVPSTTQEDTLISQQLSTYGIQAPLDIVPAASLVPLTENPNGPALLPISRSFTDIANIAGVFTSLEGGSNWFRVGTSDTTLDNLSKEVESQYNPTKRDAIAAKLQAYVLNQGYIIPIVQQVQRIYLVSPKVQGVQFNGVAYANFYTAWIS